MTQPASMSGSLQLVPASSASLTPGRAVRWSSQSLQCAPRLFHPSCGLCSGDQKRLPFFHNTPLDVRPQGWSV